MKDRIKKVRKNASLTQREFAEKLGLKQNTIAVYEMGKSGVSDAVITSICREFDINKEWLETGKGDMYNIPADDTSLAASNILENEDVPFYDTIKRIIRIYEKLDDKAQNIINKEIEDFIENAKKEG